MENLYFEPEPSGKTKRKKKEEKKNHKFLKLFVFLLFLLILILIIIWLLKGSKTVSGQYPENVKNESLICKATGLIPPKIDSIDSDEKEITINAVFGDDELKRLYFTYSLRYDTEDAAYGAEAKSHALLNKAFAASGYSADEFDAKFSRYGGNLTISLTTTSNEIDAFSAPFFMIQDNYRDGLTLQSLNEMYKQQGFNCQTSQD